MNKKLSILLLILLGAIYLLPFPANGQNDKKKDKQALKEKRSKGMFRDSLDGKFDVSKWMTNLHGVLPLPSLITEPALGYGINLALVFFHPTKQSMDKESTGDRQLSLPSMTVAGGLYTANKTWGVYAGHYGSYLEDKLRIKIFSGWLDINIDFYLTGPLGNENQLSFNLKGLPIYLGADYKLGKSKWYAGLDYFFYKNETTLKTNLGIPKFDSLNMEIQLGGLGLNVYYQNFDNSFTPNRGAKIKLRYSHNDDWLGSDYQYNTFNVTFLGFGNWIDWWVAGLRVETEGIYGDNYPFFSRPFVQLRGIPAMRYQGDYVATLETEHRFDITPRWALDGFVGFGLPFDDRDEFTMANAKWAGGGGFRYLLARWFNLYMGIDAAAGPEGWAWYIIFGSYWLGR